MQIPEFSGIGNHDRLEAVVPERCVVAAPYGRQKPAVQWNGEADNGQFGVLLKGAAESAGESSGSEVPNDSDEIPLSGVVHEVERERIPLAAWLVTCAPDHF